VRVFTIGKQKRHGSWQVKTYSRIAVRSLVEVVLRSGDIDLRFSASGRTLEGIRAHQRIQRKRPEGYRAEVPVFLEMETENLILAVGGRIDGVLETDDGILVEEIKSTRRELTSIKKKPDPTHWGQAKVYAYLLARQEAYETVMVQLTYCHLDTDETLEMVESATIGELESFFQGLVERYLEWAMLLSRWRVIRDESIGCLVFPFPAYRKGQRDMAVAVYRTLRDGGQALVQAATGIGKTMAALFPAIKTLGEGHADRIFFLTARNTGKAAAANALAVLGEKGLRLKRVSLTAKDQICFCPDATCNPDACEFAKGHFDRLKNAMTEAFSHDSLDRTRIEAVARSNRVCPFEFSLELARWADCILCDYNYAFDPRVYLRRFFEEENGDYLFLVDEAHNLVDRSREMFSARLKKSAFLELRRAVKSPLPAVYRAAGKINSWMLKERKRTQLVGGFMAEPRLPEGLEPLLRVFIRETERWLVKNIPSSYRELVLERYFEVTGFLRVWDRFDDSYVTCCDAENKDLDVKLFCLDPSGQLKNAFQRARAVVFFSATLTPATYFQDLFGCESDVVKRSIPSPFPPERLAVFVAGNVNTTYAQREQSAGEIASLIGSFVLAKRGNYLVFFPSYAYLAMVREGFEKQVGDNVRIIVQERGMDDAGRAWFLDRFSDQNHETLVGLAVMGGIFGEGIDLVGERLSGAVIVGVGLPAICPERELIREYFDKIGAGFDFAYRYPGINRVLQAAGRVIRSTRDNGAVLLADQRFAALGYRRLLPTHWAPTPVLSAREIENRLEQFWSCVDRPKNS
jgi:DNA excision repair protein ERCC-2